MRVDKKELKERTFIPYQIVITVESEEEHKKLRSDVSEVDNVIMSSQSMFKRRHLDTIFDMFNQIRSHTK